MMGRKVNDAADLIQKADMALSDLTSGGLLLPAQAKKFIRKMIKRSVLMQMATVIPMAGPKRRIEKIGFTERILKPKTSGTQLTSDQRSTPALSKVELSTVLAAAEVDIPEEVFEDNIEGDSLRKTILEEMARRAPLDLDELFLLGDTDLDLTDPFLDLLDGWLKSATSNVYDAAGAMPTEAVWKGAYKTMPQQYRALKSTMRFLTSSDAQTEYVDLLGQRGTAVGDKAAVDGIAPKWQGIPIEEVPVMPGNLGDDEDMTNALLIQPKNLTVGIQRKIRTRWDVDIRAGVVFVVMDLRMDAKFAEEEAVVKISNLAYEEA